MVDEAAWPMTGSVMPPSSLRLPTRDEATPVPATPGGSFSEGLRRGETAVPVFLMNLPLSLSAQVANNAWMEELNAKEREIRPAEAMSQFLDLYRHISRQAIVYLLPSHPGLQDQPYVANLAAVLPHCSQDTVLVSRFRTDARTGESFVGREFFRLMNFSVHETPATIGESAAFFEGEADLKHIHGNLYVGAYGIRTSLNTLSWAAERFGMQIVPFRITDPYLYHLDCCLLRVSENVLLVCTSVAERVCLQELEKHCEIIDVTLEEARAGITNSLVLGCDILCDSDINYHTKGDPLYTAENAKIRHLERICDRFGHDLRLFCMSEFYKSGALLSCLTLPIKHAPSQIHNNLRVECS